MVIRRCEADPSALANYVVALVKKDKPEKDLKALCADQLDVFLQKGMALLLQVLWMFDYLNRVYLSIHELRQPGRRSSPNERSQLEQKRQGVHRPVPDGMRPTFYNV